MFLIALVIQALFISVNGVWISGLSIDPAVLNQGYLAGSVSGGTVLHIRGTFDNEDPESNIIMVDGQACEVIQFHARSDYMQVITPPSKHPNGATVNITGLYHGGEIGANANVVMQFTYSKYNTPVTFAVNPVEAVPGDEVSFVGRWMTTSWTQFDNAKVDTQNMLMYILDSSQTFGSWDVMNLTAVLGDNDQGDINATLTLNGAYGKSFKRWTGTQYDLDGNPYNFRTLARIDSVSASSGSSAGGQDLTISGEGFPLTASWVKIEVDGSDCKITSLAYDKINCTTTPATRTDTSQTIFEGSAGLKRELWLSQTSTSLDFSSLDEVTPDFTFRVASAQIPRDEDVNLRDRMTGLFRAPATGTYKFFLSSDDGAQVFLGTSSDPASAVSVLKYTSYTSLRDQFTKATQSDGISLVEDTDYYFEVRHTQGSGSSHLDVGVLISGSTLPNTMPYVQKLQISPADVVYEVQTIKIFGSSTGPTGGKLRLVYGTTVRDPIDWDTTSGMWKCSDILNQTSYLGLGSLSCAGSWDDTNTALTYTITFNYLVSDKRYKFSADTSVIEPKNSISITNTKTPGTTTVKGSFKLGFRGAQSKWIDISTWTDGLEFYLNQQIAEFQNQLVVYGTVGFPFNATLALPWFLFDGTNFDGITVVDTNFTGGNIEGSSDPAVFTTVLDSAYLPTDGAFWPVIPSDFLRTSESAPQVRVFVNNTLAVCRGDCSYNYLSDPDFPMITSFSAASTTLTIVGTNFPLDATKLSVSVGFTDCKDISVASATTFSCTLQDGVAGAYQPVVKVIGQGIIPIDSTFTDTIDSLPTIASVSPSSGSTEGGTIVTISGTGFYDSLTNSAYQQSVTISGATCTITSTSLTEIICTAGPLGTGSGLDVVVTVNGQAATNTLSSDFYISSTTPTITSITPDYASTTFKTEIVITGTLFSTTTSDISVTIGDQICMVVSSTTTQITCHLLGGPPGTYTVTVSVSPYGAAYFDSISDQFDLKFDVTSISPAVGSVNGGTTITINGHGFSDIASSLIIIIGNDNYECTGLNVVSPEVITCKTPAFDSGLTIDTEYTVTVIGRVQMESLCKGTCKFSWSESVTPVVTSISPTSGAYGDVVTVTGTVFGTDTSKVHLSFGGVDATITSCSDTEVVATVPAVKGAHPTLKFTIDGQGDADTSALAFANKPFVSDVSPKTISQGGEDITITGAGFDTAMNFAFGSVSCTVTKITDTTASCTAGASTTSSAQNLVITGVSSYTCSDSNICAITYSSAYTPVLGSSTSGFLTIPFTAPSGNGPVDSTTVHASLGSYECTVTSVSASQLSCTPTAPAGTYAVKLHVDGYGYSTGTLNSQITLSITGVTASASSYEGGQTVTVTGTGLSENLGVYLCGFQCITETATGDSLTCLSPKVITTYSQNTFNLANSPTQLTNFTVISSVATNSAKAFDGDATTYWRDTTNTFAWIGVDAGEGRYIQLSQVTLIGGGNNNNFYSNLVGTVVQGSNDNTNWDNLYNFTTVTDYTNKWNVPVNSQATDDYPVYAYRYYRLYKEYAGNSYYINEVSIFGFIGISVTDQDVTCDLTTSYLSTSGRMLTASTSYASAITYQSSATYSITDFSPKYGTSLGGDEITFTGSFGSSTTTADVSIIIDDVSCTVTSVSSTQIKCTTSARPVYTLPSLSITIAGVGYVVTHGKTFIYAERWSATTTWGGEVPPFEGETVEIPAGMNILLDVATPHLGLILIEGGLIIEDVPGLSIDANYIYVQGGFLQIGTEENPFQNKFTITIHGDRSSPLLPYYGSQFIAFRGGVLDIHGVKRTPTWTFIDGTISPGDTTFTVAEDVDWVEGEVVVIASTSFDHNEAEMMTISSISGKTITVTTPFVHKHYGVIETYGSDTMDMRAEVGLLTRNILIQGGPEGIAQECGVHVMLFAPGDESCIGRIEYAEFYHAGQAYRLGRYPIHFHMIGKVSLSYVRGNSIHHTFNRAITTHGVHYQTLENNVVFRNKGHAYFVEDGIETMNKFIHNLGISTIASFSLLNTDQEPSTFWITNPNNIFIGNHAAGSDRFGYWIEPPEHPGGPSATTLICPPFVPLGQFANNTAHSCGKYGFRIWLGHVPLANPCSPGRDKSLRDPFSVNTPVTANYYNYTGWKNEQNGFTAEDVGDLRFIGFKVADHHKNGLEVSYSEFSTPYQTARIHDALVIGKSLNTEDDVTGAIGLTTPQTDGLLIENVRFWNFDDDMFPLGDESHSENVQSRDWGGVMHKFSGLEFHNSNKRISWNVPYRGIFKFLDDSYNGQAGSYVTAYWPHLITPECVHEPTLYNAISCDSSVAVKRVLFYNHVPNGIFSFQNLNIRRTSGDELPTEDVTVDGVTTTQPTWGKLPMTKSCQKKDPLKGWGIPIVTGYNYTLFWGRGFPLDWTEIDIRIEQFDYDEADKWAIISMNFTDHREMFNLTRGTLPSSVNKTAPGFVDVTQMKNTSHFNVATDTAGTFYWDNSTDNRRLDILINGVNDHLYQYGPIHAKAWRCYGDHCSDLATTNDSLTNLTVVYWSDPSIWPNNVLPAAGENVYVLNTWHLMLDIDTPIFHYVEINGLLEFDRTKNVSLSSEWIFVRGGKLTIGSEEYPIPPNIFHTITLHGHPNSDEFAFSNDVEGGNKVLAITGEVQMHGYPKTPYTFLAQNAYPGDSFIFVDNVDWSVGDEIVIAPSGFSNAEDEVFVITDIIGALPQYNIPAMNSSRMLIDFSTDADWKKVNNLRNLGKNPNAYDTSLSGQSATASSTGISKIMLNSTLKYYHSGVQMIIQGVTVDTRTEVGVLTRNVKIQGDGYVGWGCTSIVSDFYDVLTTSGIPAYRYGRVNMTNIEFSKCAQEDTTKGSLRFELGGTIASRVHNSVFRDSYSYAVFLREASNVELSNNFIYKTIWKGIVGSDITNVTISDNVLIKTANRGFLSNTLDVPACFFICADNPLCSNVSTVRNRAVGSDSISFILGGQNCDTNQVTHYVSDNVAHSSTYGYIISGQNNVKCAAANGLKAWFCEQGVGTQGGRVFRFQFTNLVLVENQMGISIRGQHDDDFVSYVSTITDSLIVGRTQQSYCDSSNCTAADCADRKGIVTGVHDVKIFDLEYDQKIKLPLAEAKKPECGYGHWEYTGTTFVNLVKTGCGRDYAISGNDRVPNLPQPNLFSKSSFINVDKLSIAYFPAPDPSLIGVGFCGNWVCTGANNNLVQDVDGTLTGGTIGGAIIPAVPGIASLSICQQYSNAYICPYDATSGEIYEYVIIESLDSDKWNRTFSPLNITSFDVNNGKAFKNYNFGAFRNDLNEYEDMTWEGFYRDNFHLSRFGSIIYTGQYYNLTATGTPPTKMSIFTEASLDQSRGFVMALRYDSPVIVDLYVNGTKVDAIEYISGESTPVVQLSDPTGTNRWFHENATIQWVQRGHANVTLIQTSSVRLTMQLDMTLKEFYSDNTRATLIDKLASVLNIPSYRIRIASIKQGSVIMNMFIKPDETLAGQTDSTGAKASDKELASINTLVNKLASTGELSTALGKTVLSIDSQTSIVNSTASVAVNTGGSGSTDGGQGTGGDNGGNTGGGNTDNGGGNTDNGGGSNIVFKGTFNEAVSDWVIGLLVGIILAVMAIGSVVAYAFHKRKRLFLAEPPSAKVLPILEEVEEQHAISFDSPKKQAFEFEAGEAGDLHRIFTKEEEKEADQGQARTIEGGDERKVIRHASLVDV